MDELAVICPKRMVRRQCAEAFGIDEYRMVGGNRSRDVLIPRHATCYVLRRRFPDMSYRRIGMLMGGRDHSTVIHGICRIEALMERDPELAGKVHALVGIPVRDARHHDAHVQQWAAFMLQKARLAEWNALPAPPASVGITEWSEELAEFIEVPRVWCDQCDRAVTSAEKQGCKARLCSLRPAEKLAA